MQTLAFYPIHRNVWIHNIIEARVCDTWMDENKLKMEGVKAEVMVVGCKHQGKSNFLTFITIDEKDNETVASCSITVLLWVTFNLLHG